MKHAAPETRYVAWYCWKPYIDDVRFGIVKFTNGEYACGYLGTHNWVDIPLPFAYQTLRGIYRSLNGGSYVYASGTEPTEASWMAHMLRLTIPAH